MTHKIFLLAAALLLGWNARAQYCTNNARYTELAYFDSTQISIGANIQYGIAQDFQGHADTLLMDLYYPNLLVDSSPRRPFIMLFHGGGFSSGNKQSGDIRDLCVHLARRGFVSASVNYRLGHDFSEYGQYKARYRAIQDGHAAMRFIVKNANTVRIDTNWLFVGGQSAGALLALGMVYADQSELDSVSLLYSATAASAELGNLYTSGNGFSNTYSIKAVFNNWGGVTETEVDREEMIPTVAFHGGQDTTVRIDADSSFAYYTLIGSRALHSRLGANAICSELTVDTTGGHGIFRNASSVFRAQRASCFFKSIFCNRCTGFYSTDSVISHCSWPLGEPELSTGTALKVYPNPFKQSIRLEGVTGRLELSLYNSLGQELFKREVSAGELELDVLPGIYFMNLRQLETNQIFSSKLLKQ